VFIRVHLWLRALAAGAFWSTAALVILAAPSCRSAEDTPDNGARETPKQRGSETRPTATSGPASPASRAEVQELKKEAREVIARVIEDFPHSAVPHVMMGAMHARFGNGAEAMKCWEKCLKIDPRHLDAHAAMAVLALDAGQYEQAVKRWRKAMEIDPEVAGGRIGLARALMGLGKAKQAASVLEQELAKSPNQAPARTFLGKAYLVSGQFEKAGEHYKAAIAVQSDYSRAYYGLSMVCARLGRKDQARRYMEKFRKLKARDRAAAVNRKGRYRDVAAVRDLVALAYTEAGVFYRAGGYPIRAEQHWLKAAEFAPTNPVCRAMLGSLYTANLRYAEALRIYEQVVKLSPDSAEYRMRLGTLHVQLGQLDAGMAALERAIELDGDNRQYRKIYQEIRRRKGLPPAEGTR